MAYTITDLGLTVSVLNSLTSDTQYYPKIEFEALLSAGNSSVAIQRRLTQSFNGYPGTGATYSRLNGLSFNYTEVTTPSAVSNALLYEALRVMFANISSVAGTVTSVTGNVVDNTIPTAPVVTAISTALVHAATSKATPVDADELPLVDSAASFGLKRLTWANLKATTKTYFDTLYQAALGYTAENVANKDTDGTMAANSDTKYASQKAAKTYTDAKVQDAIANGVTTIAPSQNAVFDALALKQDALGYTPEDVANKASDLTSNSDTFYPSVKTVNTALAALVIPTTGTWTPTVSSGSNLTGTPTAAGGKYVKTGNMVHFSVTFTGVDPTLALATSFKFDLPIASTLGTATDLNGVGSSLTQSCRVSSDTAGNAQASWTAVDLTSQTFVISGDYIVN